MLVYSVILLINNKQSHCNFLSSSQLVNLCLRKKIVVCMEDDQGRDKSRQAWEVKTFFEDNNSHTNDLKTPLPS